MRRPLPALLPPATVVAARQAYTKKRIGLVNESMPTHTGLTAFRALSTPGVVQNGIESARRRASSTGACDSAAPARFSAPGSSCSAGPRLADTLHDAHAQDIVTLRDAGVEPGQRSDRHRSDSAPLALEPELKKDAAGRESERTRGASGQSTQRGRHAVDRPIALRADRERVINFADARVPAP